MIYFLQRADGAIKIGTTKNYSHRLIALRAEYGNLTLLTFMDGSHKLESLVHQKFSHLEQGESEWFHPGSDLMEFIQSPKLRAEFTAEYEKEVLAKRAARIERERTANPTTEFARTWNIVVRLAEERNTDPVTMIINELNCANGNMSAAARALGVTRQVLYYHLRDVKMQTTRVIVVDQD